MTLNRLSPLSTLFLLFFAIISCNTNRKQVPIPHSMEFRDMKKLVKENVIHLELDSFTAPMINALQEWSNSNTHLLIYLNEETGNLYINDLVTNKIIRKIRVKDSLQTHNKMYQGFYYHNKDSIFLISFKPKITLINDSGTIIRDYEISELNSKEKFSKYFLRGLYSSTALASYLADSTLYIGSVVVGNTKNQRKKIQIKLNVHSGEIASGNVVFPEIYSKYDFGSINYEIYSVGANKQNNLLIYSFPAYQNLIVNPLLTDSVFDIPAESRYILSFTEYDIDDYKTAKSSPKFEYFMTTPCYGGIYYDKYRDVYYRLALLPVAERNVNYEEKNAPYKQLSVMILDKDFKSLGETKLDANQYQMFSAFVSKDGFNIQNRTLSDTTLDFTTFILSK